MFETPVARVTEVSEPGLGLDSGMLGPRGVLEDPRQGASSVPAQNPVMELPGGGGLGVKAPR